MGLVMHLAPIARRIVVGLTLLVVSFAVLPMAFAWDLFGRESQSAPAVQSMPPDRTQSNATARRGPLFKGQELRLPKMPFGRTKPAANVPAGSSYPAQQGSPRNAAGQTASRFAASANTPLGYANQPSGGNRSIGPARTQQPQQRMAHGGAVRQANRPQPYAQVQSQVPDRRAIQSPPSQPVSARVNDARIASGQPTLLPAERVSADAIQTPAALRQAPAAAPQSPADQLIAQAHEQTATAASEADYSRIIDTCRRARASQASPATHRYAGELASWAFNRRGQLNVKAGRHEEALADFDLAIRADSTRWRAIHNRGVLLAQAGQYERAFDDFARTITLNPNFANAYSNRAALLMVAGDLEGARDDYRRAIEIDPALAVAYRGCGRAHHQLRQLDEAIACFDDAVRLAPGDAYAVECRADVLTDLGRYGEAAADYERAIQLNPQSVHAYSSFAWLLATCPDASVRNPQLAVESATMAIQLSGEKDAVCFDALAAAQASAGDFNTAIETVQQAVRLAEPEEREAYQARLLMYQHAKPYRIAPVGEVVQASYEPAQ
jgi:tetratricopeptide (TPR) repeat protein